MEIKIPFLGDGIDTATVLGILVNPGDSVAVDDTLLELETDKATAPVPSTAAGTVEAIHVKEGDSVKQGTLVVSLSGGADVATTVSDTVVAPVISMPVAPVSVAPVGGIVNPDPVSSPSIRQAARVLGLDLRFVAGSGNGGRITSEDVQRYLAGLQAEAVSQSQAPSGAVEAKVSRKPLPDFSKFGSVETEKLSSMRTTIAKHMAEAWARIPHVTQFGDVDISDLMSLRKKHVEAFKKKKGRLTVTVFILKALVQALKEFPSFNASFDEDAGELIVKQYYHIGVAVDTDYGLVVPVIRDVDQKSMLELSIELETISEKARDRKLGLEDLQGGTFTVSNLGSLGVGHFTPIVNHPEVAILGVGRGEKMPLALSYDHRVIDGADGARFITALSVALSDFDAKLIK